MDVNAAWKELAEVYGEDDARSRELATTILTWIDCSGFPPTITGKFCFDRTIAWSTCQEILT